MPYSYKTVDNGQRMSVRPTSAHCRRTFALRSPVRATSDFRPSVEGLCGRPRLITLKSMNPILRKVSMVACMLMWLAASIFVPLSLSPEYRAQFWVAVADYLIVAAILWGAWMLDGERTKSRAFDFATLWFIPIVGLNVSRTPLWSWSRPFWPWLAVGAGLGACACIYFSAKMSAAEAAAAGKEPEPPASKPRLAMAIVCMGVFFTVLCFEGWPESLTRLLWAKIAINALALGSLFAMWRLNPQRSYRWNDTNRYYVLLGIASVSSLGGGISQWAWENQDLWVIFSYGALAVWMVFELWSWRSLKQPPASPVSR